MKATLYNLDGKKTDEINISEEVFKAKLNPALVAQAVRVYLANQRQGTQSAKTRGEITGSSRKIYKQKGTGNARHGDRYAPNFVGGGIVFAPKPRDHSLHLPAKMKRLALFSSLTDKYNDKNIIFIESLSQVEAKTKEVVKILNNLENLWGKTKVKLIKTLIILSGEEKNLVLAGRNMSRLTLIPARQLNPYVILNNQRVIMTKDAYQKFSLNFVTKKTPAVTKEVKVKKTEKSVKTTKK